MVERITSSHLGSHATDRCSNETLKRSFVAPLQLYPLAS